jgi:hypothetical protein
VEASPGFRPASTRGSSAESPRPAILFRQQGVGLVVAGERLGFGIETEDAARAIGDLAEMDQAATEMGGFGVGVRGFAVAEAIEEVAQVFVAALRSCQRLLETAAGTGLAAFQIGRRDNADFAARALAHHAGFTPAAIVPDPERRSQRPQPAVAQPRPDIFAACNKPTNVFVHGFKPSGR